MTTYMAGRVLMNLDSGGGYNLTIYIAGRVFIQTVGGGYNLTIYMAGRVLMKLDSGGWL